VKPRILIVEDEFITATDIGNSLEEMGYSVAATADTGEEAVRMAGELAPDLILMDITLTGRMTGIEAAEIIREKHGIPVIFLTAHSGHSTVTRSLSSNPYGYIVKPFETTALRVGIEVALYKHGIEKKLRESERTILVLLNALPDALLLVDRDLRIMTLNQAMAGRLGRFREELMGETVTDALLTGKVDTDTGQMRIALSGGATPDFEEEHNRRWYRTSVSLVGGEGGCIPCVTIQSHDISDWKDMEDRMKREGLSQIEQNMEQFLALNDEIRNPLQVIESLAGEAGGPIRDRIEEQVRIIDDLVTRLDRGWIESEKVREFLIRHYQHGRRVWDEGCGTVNQD